MIAIAVTGHLRPKLSAAIQFHLYPVLLYACASGFFDLFWVFGPSPSIVIVVALIASVFVSRISHRNVSDTALSAGCMLIHVIITE